MPKKSQKKLIYILLLLALGFITMGFKCGGPPAGLEPGKPTPITLNYWKVFEATSDISGLLNEYQALHPHILVNYKNFTYDEFEYQLLNALAEDKGPDIISLHTTWLRKYQPKLVAMPATVTMEYEIVQGTFKKETFTEKRTQATPSLKNIKDLFPDVVYDNQVINGQVFGLPLSIDTLALFYNRDLLNNAGIVYPPKTWDEFKEQVIKLTKLDQRGNILQSGAAFGTATNVERAGDILSLLMMQNNAPMGNASGTTFNKIAPGDNIDYIPAVQALTFYTSFASPAKQVYTWNDQIKNSLQAFMAGETAFYFGYAYNIPTISAQSKINYEITQVPQGRIPANFANYWIETVSNKSQHQDEAWDLILFMTTDAEANMNYLKSTRRPTALRENITTQLEDLQLSAFANQILTAKSWYKGKDPQKAEEIFKNMITDTLIGTYDVNQIVNLSAQRINATY